MKLEDLMDGGEDEMKQIAHCITLCIKDFNANRDEAFEIVQGIIKNFPLYE